MARTANARPETGLLILAFHSFVIRTPRHVILVDTCGGNDKERPQKLRYHRNNWPYLENLAAAGIAIDEVDYALHTSSRRSRRLEHAAGGRPLGADISQRKVLVRERRMAFLAAGSISRTISPTIPTTKTHSAQPSKPVPQN